MTSFRRGRAFRFRPSRAFAVAMLVPLVAMAGTSVAADRPSLQVFNGTSSPADVFWLADATSRVPQGTIAPGGDTVITTTLGHRFSVVASDGTETILTSNVPVQAYRVGGIPAFYTRHIDVSGFPIVASARVSPYALKEAAYLVTAMLAERTDIVEALVASGSRMTILAWSEFTTDQPEFERFARQEPPRGFPGMSGRDYWDARARGTGGSATDPICTCAEENLLAYPGDPYAAECILIHELAHMIHLRGMNNLDPTFDQRVEQAYRDAMARGLWKDKYASVNSREYFAEGVQSWFDDNRVNDHDHNHVHLRNQLIEYDPGLAALCREVFGDTTLTYTKPTTRLSGHLEGYDPSKAPTFAWPERLAEAKRLIRDRAESRGN